MADGNMTVALVKKEADDFVVSHLRNLLRQAEAGEVVGVVTIAQRRGEVTSGWAFRVNQRSKALIGELAIVQQQLGRALAD
jgi:hypothetical protein